MPTNVHSRTVFPQEGAPPYDAVTFAAHVPPGDGATVTWKLPFCWQVLAGKIPQPPLASVTLMHRFMQAWSVYAVTEAEHCCPVGLQEQLQLSLGKVRP